MKTMIFPLAGLLVGLLGGTVFGGLKERNVILAEKAAAEAQAAEEDGISEDGHESDEAGGHGEDTASGQSEDPSIGGGEVGSDPQESHSPESGEEPTSEDQSVSVGETGAAPPPEETAAPGSEQPEATLAAIQTDALAPPESTPATITAQQREGSGFLSEGSGGPERMAKIFGAMKAPDAAKVLQNLDDLEVRAILSFLSNRKAAEILGNFEPERAAALSRLVLGSPGGGAR